MRRIEFFFLAVLLAASCACRAGAATCDVCGRDECTALAFRVEYGDGGRQVTCCPRCASHAVAESHGREVARLVARDFATGRDVDARSALYVEGSDFEHCNAPREKGTAASCCRVLAYDRCLPGLVAFERRESADSFMHDHGGSLRTFADLKFGER